MPVDALTGTGTVGNSYNESINDAHDLTVGAANGSGTFSGSIVGNGNGQDDTAQTALTSGALSLIKLGTGTQTLTGANSYRDTTISAGTLEIGGTAGTLGLGTITNNAALVFSRSNNYTQTIAIGGTGTLTQAGGATLTLSGANTYNGATNITGGGTLALDATGSIGNTSGVSLGTNGTFDVSAKAGYTVNNLTGTGNVIGALTVSTQLAIGNSPGTTDFPGNLTLDSAAPQL